MLAAWSGVRAWRRWRWSRCWRSPAVAPGADDPAPTAQTHAVIAYGTRDNLEWLYRIPGGDGDGKGEDAMRAFMKEHGDGLG